MSEGFISHFCHQDPTEYEKSSTTKICVDASTGKTHHYAWINGRWHNTHISNPGDRERILKKTENYWALIERGLGKESHYERERYIADGVKKIDRKLAAGGHNETGKL